MRKPAWAYATLLLLVINFIAMADSANSFDHLKSLVGSWEGTAKWSGARTGEYKLDVEYSLTGNGTAVVENLIAEGKTTMTSVYHRDGENLRMTHFCGAGNQPRLVASSTADPQKISFKLVDITNLASPDAPHVTGAELVLESSDAMSLTFTFESNGKVSTELIQLHRKQGA